MKQAFIKNKLFQNIALMSSATIVAQLINILVQPILTRVVPAETLGVFTFLVSMANIAIPIASLKIDMLIVSEPEDSKAQYITDVCVILSFMVSIVFFLVIAIGYSIKIHVFTQYGPVIFIVPVMVLTNGLRFLFISYNNRYRQYKVIGFVGILRESTRGIIQVMSGFLSLGVLGQVAGYTLAPLAGLRRQTTEYVQKYKNRPRISRELFVNVLNRGRNQILFLVPAQFVNGFASSLVIIFISVLYSTGQLGYYSAGVRLLEVPLIFIAANVSKVFYKQICEDVNLGKPVSYRFLKISLALFGVSVLGFGLLFLIAPSFSRFVFGPGYEVAGYYIRCMCLMYSVRLVTTSFSGLFTIFEKQVIELCLTLLLIIASSIIYLCCKRLDLPIESFLWAISIAYSTLYAAIWAGYFLLCKKHDQKLSTNHI